MPMMAFIGVRISWLMLARKSLFGTIGDIGGIFRALELFHRCCNSLEARSSARSRRRRAGLLALECGQWTGRGAQGGVLTRCRWWVLFAQCVLLRRPVASVNDDGPPSRLGET